MEKSPRAEKGQEKGGKKVTFGSFKVNYFEQEDNDDDAKADEIPSATMGQEELGLEDGDDDVCPPVVLSHEPETVCSSEEAGLTNSDVPFVESEHGRLRRIQRGIDKEDLREAVSHGTRCSTYSRPNGDPAAIYTYKDISYVVNERTWEEVTSYTKPPKMEPQSITSTMQEEHDRAKQTIRTNRESWTSHSVFVVDTSGSMRNSDMFGARHRLASVWICLAHEVLAARLEQGTASLTDVVSVVTFSESATIVFQEEPWSWVLYNKVLSIYSSNQVKPHGHGMFLGGIQTAEELLIRNDEMDACALTLMFLSDGAPSDKGIPHDQRSQVIAESVGSLARKYGRRLTFTAIGIGGSSSFSTLQTMTNEAADFGAQARFYLPAMTTSSLAESFSSVATSLTSSQLELTDIATSQQRKVRTISRERRTNADIPVSAISPAGFRLFKKKNVKRHVYEEWYEGGRKDWDWFEEPLQDSHAEYVAMCRDAFGEGRERFAYRFYEIAKDGRTVVGKSLVAKENRFVLEKGTSRDQFVRKFCQTQTLAGRLANEFNQKLDRIPVIGPGTPRVRMLDCSVYELTDSGETTFVLVEDRLFGEWQKWNGNGGPSEDLAPSAKRALLHKAYLNLEHRIEAEEFPPQNERSSSPVTCDAAAVAHAFSHFSYWASGRKRLVCDLQGVHDTETNQLVLSDPAIHYHDPTNRRRKRFHGFTDFGRDGMAMFFQVHVQHGHCGPLCRLVNRGFRRPKRDQQLGSIDHERRAYKRSRRS